MFLARALRLCVFGGLSGIFVFSGCGRSDVEGYEESETGTSDVRSDVRPDVRDVGPELDVRDASDARDARDASDARDVVIPTDGDAQCGPGNCSGCCDNGLCLVGLADTQCGADGKACTSCLASAQVCFPRDPLLGGICDVPPPTCDAVTCPDGCCSGNACISPGTSDTACGVAGATCDNCVAKNSTCSGSVCIPVPPKCTPENCSGCCDASGTCQLGFAASSCGSAGNACVDCSAQGSTCSVSTTPRVCANQTQCPAAYPGCKGASTPVPTVKSACNAADLDNAQAACAGGADTTPCNEYFQVMASIKPGCASCLEPFHEPLFNWSGVHACVAPYVAPSCNGTTGCYADCAEQSCALCSAGQKSQCDSFVRSSQCSSYLTSSFPCVLPALLGAGFFCNPLNYSSYGEWLRGVGAHYCSP